jgi:hypothetical protein
MFALLLLAINPSIIRVKYSGGDWYNDPDIIPNLAREINKRTEIRLNEQERILTLNDSEIFSYPFLFITGHGKFELTKDEEEALSKYLWNGGFVYADDDYGMDEYLKAEIEKIFPEHHLVEIPKEHEIYNINYKFPDGLPKIHEHYKGPPIGYGLFISGKLSLFYTYNSNLSDGWASPSVHNDPEELREKAFKMGINIYLYALTH